METRTMFFGRAFEINGTVILPCGTCGTPLFPYRQHECVGRSHRELAEFNQQLGDWLGDEEAA